MLGKTRIAFLFTAVIALAGVTPAHAQSLKVMTWNIQHGNEDGVGGENEQVDFILAQNPDVVILQEVSTPDHHLTYKSLLESKTAKTWNVKYKEHCQLTESSTQVCNPDNDGVAIFTPLTFQDVPGDEILWGRDGFTDGRRAVRVKVRVGTQDVQVFGTHLAAGGGFEHIRVSQIDQLKAWMNGFSGPRILGGDLNAVPGSAPIQNLINGVNGSYVDTWAALRSDDGFTHNAKVSLTRRIDYLFSQAGSTAQPTFVDRPAFPGPLLSDHYAVVAVYAFGPPTGSGPLVGHWKFDDGTGQTALDSAGGANGTLVNNPTWTTPGKLGGALHFNGTTQLVSIPNQSSWNKVSSKYTVAFWVKVEQVEDYAGAVAVGNWGTRALEIMTTSNQWHARIATNGVWGCDIASETLGYLQTPDGAYHHVAVVLDATAGRCDLYSDGVLRGSDVFVNGMTAFGTTQNLHIGGFGDANRLQSVIDDVRLYDSALSAADIQTLVGDTTPPSVTLTAPLAGATVSGTTTVSADAFDNIAVAGVQFKLNDQNLGVEDTISPYEVSWNTTTVTNGSHVLKAVARDAAGNMTTSASVTVTVNNPTGSGPLVGHWKLDDGSGSPTAADSSGGGALGTLINSPTWTTLGRLGGALGFNGTTQLVSIPNQSSWNKVSSKYTVAFWVKVEQVENYAGVVAIGNWGTRALEIMTVTNQWSARIATDGVWGCDVTSPVLNYLQTPDGAFHHVAVVLDTTAGRCDLYSDGVLRGTDEYVNGMTSFGTTQNLHIGGFGDANRLQSVVDDVRFYNSALTPAEVQALAAGGGG